MTKDWPNNCVDSIITDPPYGLGFMGKEWDTFKRSYLGPKRESDKKRKPRIDGRTVAAWNDGADAGTYDYSRNAEFQQWFTVWATEALRIAKPGAMMLVFGGTRTVHRLTCAIEDAGWQIRDKICWLFGSGFPKSLNISKAIDKAKGAKRKQLTKNKSDIFGCYQEQKVLDAPADSIYSQGQNKMIDNVPVTAPATDLAKLWDGYGTGLKPAYEDIVVCMKPLDGTFAANAEKWGVAGLNIHGSRIGVGDRRMCGTTNKSGESSYILGAREETRTTQGRWPANCILDEEAAAMLDEQSGVKKSSKLGKNCKSTGGWSVGLKMSKTNTTRDYSDSGGASRFFYCAKASRAERNAGLEGMEEKAKQVHIVQSAGRQNVGKTESFPMKNHHPTVKPLKLMEYLCTLLRPPTKKPILLDCFAGSGTTLIAALNTGWNFVGIEKEPDYVEIAKRRIEYWQKQRIRQLPLFGTES